MVFKKGNTPWNKGLKNIVLKPALDLTGQEYGRLKIIKRVENMGQHTRWLCKCSCGNEKIIRSNDLRQNKTKSCGCLQKEIAYKYNSTHKMSKTSFFKRWAGMIKRCTDKNQMSYKNYGGRGIKVCERWYKFENFRDDMYKSYLEHKKNNDYTSLDRIDNNGNYEPSNCRWATRKEQNKNRRYTWEHRRNKNGKFI